MTDLSDYQVGELPQTPVREYVSHSLEATTHNKHNISGKRFGRLMAITPHHKRHSDGSIKWICRCDCGRETVVRISHILSGATKSCGCGRYSHGMARTPEYNIWMGMKRRCLYPTAGSFEHYGARGIKICNRWLESFENFYCDMGPRPSRKHSIDRIDVNGNYEPSNCRWATSSEQAKNKRKIGSITRFTKEEMSEEIVRRNAGIATATGPLVKKMQDKRSENNINWMKVLDGFIEYAPKEVVKEVLCGINRLDNEIGIIWDEIADAIEESGC